MEFIRWFREVGVDDVALVGGEEAFRGTDKGRYAGPSGLCHHEGPEELAPERLVLRVPDRDAEHLAAPVIETTVTTTAGETTW